MRQDERDSYLSAAEANNVKDWMHAKRITQAEVAERMGLRDKSYINRILNPKPNAGVGLSLAQLRRLCAAVDMPLHALFQPRDDGPQREPSLIEVTRELAVLAKQVEAMAARQPEKEREAIRALADAAARQAHPATSPSRSAPARRKR